MPSESTIRRCLQRLAPDRLDELIGAWMWLRTSTISGRRVIAFDGKTLRGALYAAGYLVHLLAGLCQHTGTVVAQLGVGAKTNEIPLLTKLLETIDITGAIITADALHCQRGTADYITGRGGHYIFTVKDNQRTLRKQLKDLPWKQIPVLDTSIEHGHGRTAKRVLKATEINGGIGFPKAVQVLQLTRTSPTPRTAHATPKSSTPSPRSRPPTPSPATLPTGCAATGTSRIGCTGSAMSPTQRIIRKIRTGGGPQVMATLRNTVIGLLRLTGHDNIAAALRHHARDHHRPIKLLMSC